jgi:hypothetical protein
MSNLVNKTDELKATLAARRAKASEDLKELRREIERRERKELADRKAAVGRLAAHAGALGLTDEEIVGALAVAVDVKKAAAGTPDAGLAGRFCQLGATRLAGDAAKKPFGDDAASNGHSDSRKSAGKPNGHAGVDGAGAKPAAATTAGASGAL